MASRCTTLPSTSRRNTSTNCPPEVLRNALPPEERFKGLTPEEILEGLEIEEVAVTGLMKLVNQVLALLAGRVEQLRIRRIRNVSRGTGVIDHESPFTSQLQLLLLSLRAVRISFALGFTLAGSRWGIGSHVLPQRVCTQLPDHGLVWQLCMSDKPLL